MLVGTVAPPATVGSAGIAGSITLFLGAGAHFTAGLVVPTTRSS